MSETSTVLASDMDGTFIPLEGNAQNLHDLASLADELGGADVELLYVTGRHLELAIEAVREHGLPCPAWLICDVGTSIYRHVHDHDFQPDEDYWRHLHGIVGDLGTDELSRLLAHLVELERQPPEKQSRFKLSYDCPAGFLQRSVDQVQETLDRHQAPYRVIASVDPFSGGGLVDLLPRNASKAYALQWWVTQYERPAEAILFAGDSGNDLAALSAGYRSIVVGNAPQSVIDQVVTAHRAAGWQDRLFVASHPATSGVLEGFRYFTRHR